MSRTILAVTLVVLLLPLVFIAVGAVGWPALTVLGLLLIVLYLWVWLLMRPSRFVVSADALEVIWPLKRRRLARREIASVRLVDTEELRAEIGWGMRVGVGGLWGGFGWLWTQRRGIVQLYVSRQDGLVWIEPVRGRPWLITPETHGDFVRALSTPASP